MADDTKLLAVIEANTKQFENALKRIEKQTAQTFGKADQSVKRLESSLRSSSSQILSLGRSFAAAFGVGFAVGGIASLPGLLRDVVRQAADIGDTADKIGLTTDALQELNFAAQQTGSTAETMTSALEQFAKRIGDAAQNGGDLAKIFKANGIALKDANGALRPLNDLLNEYANLIRGAVSPSDQFVLSTEAFGRGAGADMVLTLRDGADGLRRFADEAQNTGQVIERSLIKQAQEIDDKFDQLAGTLATFAQEQVLIFVRDLSNAFQQLSGWLSAVRDAANAGAAALDNLGGANDPEAIRAQLAEAEQTLAGIQDRAAKGINIPGGSLEDAIKLVQRLRGELAALQAENKAAVDSTRTIVEPRTKDDEIIIPTILPPKPPPKTGKSKAQREAEAAAKELERERQAVLDLISDLEFERKIIGLSNEQREIEIALRRAGTVATEEQRAEITGLVAAGIREQEALDGLIDRMDALRDAASSTLDAFSQSIQNGEGATEALKAALVDVLKTLVQIGQQQVIASLFGLSGTPGGGLIGGLVGGLFGGGSQSASALGLSNIQTPNLASSVAASRRSAPPVIRLEVVEGALFRPVVTGIAGAVSVKQAGLAEQRAVARGPAVARDMQRRVGTP